MIDQGVSMQALKTILIVLIVGCSLSSCGKSENPEASGDTANDRPTIALIMKSLANEFFVTMAEGARKHQQQHSSEYELIVNGTKNESDLAQQVALVDQMVARNVDAIVIAPADSKAIVPALARAASAGITIINIDNRLDKKVMQEYRLRIPFVGPDNRAGAKQVGDVLAAELSAGDAVAILEGIPTAFNSQQRRAGFEDAAHEAGLDIVSIQSASWDQLQAATVTSGLLVQFPQLRALMCANDSMAIGAISAIRQAGRGKEIKVVGFDNIPAVKGLLEDGGLIATADQHADELAVFGIEYVLKAQHKDAALEDLQTRVDLVTAPSMVTAESN